jgi:hypothetical protein
VDSKAWDDYIIPAFENGIDDPQGGGKKIFRKPGDLAGDGGILHKDNDVKIFISTPKAMDKPGKQSQHLEYWCSWLEGAWYTASLVRVTGLDQHQ